MKYVTLAIAIAAAPLAATPAQADVYTLSGAFPCSALVEEDANDAFRLANQWWIFGYFSGRNKATEGVVGEPAAGVSESANNEAIYQRVLEYCRGHPNVAFHDATSLVYESMR